VKIVSVGDRVADVDPHTKADTAIARAAFIVKRDLLLHLYAATHGPIDTAEHDKQRVAASLHNPAAMRRYRRIDHVTPQRTQPF
jgi:hypothetical protein